MNRRDFIKVGSGAFFVAAANRVLGAAAPSNRVRLAIMGCREGGRGKAVLTAMMKTPGVEIAWVCDVDSRAMDFAAKYVEDATGFRPRKEKDIRRVLEDRELDGIICETPDHWHATAAWLAMDAGKAVYVEKPCCFCPAEGEKLIAKWRSSGMVFQMGNQRRSSTTYRPAIAWAKDGLPLGELKYARAWYDAVRPSNGIGKAVPVPEWLDWDLWQGPAPRTEFHDNYVHYNWHWFRRWGTAESGNNAPHFLDVARWALGVRFPKRVVSGGGLSFPHPNDEYEWPDTFNMTFEYPGEKTVTWEGMSHLKLHKYMGYSTGVVVYGDKGSLLFAPDDSVTAFDAKGGTIRKWELGGKTATGSLTDPTQGIDPQHSAKFVACIRSCDLRTNSPADEAVMSSFMPIVGNVAQLSGEAIRLDPETGRLLTKAGEAFWDREYEKGWKLA